MLTYIIGAVVVLFILKQLMGGSSPKKNPKGNIEELRDNEDTIIEISAETKRTVDRIRPYQGKRKTVVKTPNKTVEIYLGWSNQLRELLEATDIVYSNAEMTGRNIMNKNRFHYYCNLHFRSHLADSLCRQKKDEIKPEYTKINELIKRLNDKSDPLRVSKNDYNQIVAVKDAMKMVLNLLSERSNRLSIQTGTIRDKIGQECGKRGYEWWLKRKENAELERQKKQG